MKQGLWKAAGLTFLVSACGIDEQVHQKALDDLAQRQKEVQACQASLEALQAEHQALQKSNADLNQRFENTRNDLQNNLKTTEQELGELRKQRQAAEARLNAFRQLQEGVREMVDTGQLKAAFRRGQMVLELPAEVLFSSGRANLSRNGREALGEVATALLEFSDRRFLIAGHTDDRAIQTARFPNNWHLSTERALSVLEFFVEKGMKPTNLAAVGFGEFDPIADNDSPDGRALNRRIEIILVPDLSELPSMIEG